MKYVRFEREYARRLGWRCLVAASCLASCAPTANPSSVVVSREAAGRTPIACPRAQDVAGFLARHATAYGTIAKVAAALPRTFVGTATVDGQWGSTEFVLGPAQTRLSTRFGILLSARGVDERGPWELTVGGALLRERPEEGTQAELDGWLARRLYAEAFDPDRDEVSCLNVGGTASTVFLTFKIPKVGTPTLTFDVPSASLREEAHRAPGGLPTRTVFETWSSADPTGVRWPMTRDETGTAEIGLRTYVDSRPGLVCETAAGGVAPGATACFTPPASPVSIVWPTNGVHVPFTFDDGALLFRLKLGARDAWATLDSGAEVTAVDSATVAGRGLDFLMGANVGAATQHAAGSFVEIDGLRVAGLTAEHLVAVKLACAGCGRLEERRPEVILGLPFFAASAVRIDYAKQDIAFAPSARALLPRPSLPLPLRVLNRQLAVEAVINGQQASLQLDTGSANGLSLARPWADAMGLPGGVPVARVRYAVGAGESESDVELFRLAKASLGPIVADDALTLIHEWPRAGNLAGLAGNQLFARCAAIVIDVRERTVWLEPPCDRTQPERKLKWDLIHRESAAFPRNPWVIGALAVGGSAERAGLREGDRILSFDGHETRLDLEPIRAADTKPAGTRIEVVVDRGGQRVKITVELGIFLQRSSAPSH